MTARPVGITVLAVLLFLNMAAYAMLAVLSILDRNALAAFLQAISPGGAGPAAVHLSMGRLLPVYYTAFVSITGVLAMGFWRLWNWTRIMVLALIGLNFIGAVAETLSAVRRSSADGVFLARVAASVLISLLVGWYLLSAKVRAAFRFSATRFKSELPNRSVHHA